MKKEKEKLLAVAQEIHFAKALAANDKQLRERALRRLNKWFNLKSKSSLEFTEEGFMRIWKGLFYCVWMSDKPLVQEDTVESIAHLLHCFSNFEDFLSFIRCFYQSMSQAWFGLDQHRLDKYMMLVRRFIRQSFVYLRKEEWNVDKLRLYSEDVYKALTMAPVGFMMHLADIYIVELSKVGEGKLKSEVVVELVKPWAKLLACQSDVRVINAIKKHVFLYLIRQTDLAIKHETKFRFWKSCGFPGGHIDMMKEVERDDESDYMESEYDDDDDDNDEDDGDEEVFLDPRAGRVDTILPPVDFQPKDIAQLLHVTKISSSPVLPARQSKSFTSLIDKFKELERGKYPLGTHTVPKLQDDSNSEDDVDKAVSRLSSFENRILSDSGSNRKRKSRDNERRDSFGSFWNVSESGSEPDLGGISLSLTPHSFSSSPWTVNEIDLKEGRETTVSGDVTSQVKKRKVSRTPQQSCVAQQTPVSRPSVSTLKLSIHSSVDRMKQSTPVSKKKSKVIVATKMQNGEMNGGESLRTSSRNGEVEITLSKLTTPAKAISKSPLSIKKLKTPLSEKKVAFALSKNRAQEAEEYVKSVENSPMIPYDASKKPVHGVLKPCAIASPINPFYVNNPKRLKKKSI